MGQNSHQFSCGFRGVAPCSAALIAAPLGGSLALDMYCFLREIPSSNKYFLDTVNMDFGLASYYSWLLEDLTLSRNHGRPRRLHHDG
jgi:hypothetical protein